MPPRLNKNKLTCAACGEIPERISHFTYAGTDICADDVGPSPYCWRIWLTKQKILKTLKGANQ